MGRRRDLREGERRRSRIRRISLVLAVTAMMTGGGISCVLVFGLPAPVQARVDILPDRNAVDGSLHAADGTELEDGQYRVVVNQLPTMKEGSQECNLEFENPPENRYGSRINLYLKSTGELLGGTRRVDPGNYVETVELEKMLEPGDYPVTALIELFEKKEPAGGLSLDITLHVEKQDGGEAE